MNGDDERDYDEERANAQIDRDDTGMDFPDSVVELREKDLTEVIVAELPECDFCAEIHRDCDNCPDRTLGRLTAHYDGATKLGQWANMCEFHYVQFGIGLGTGRGQRLILRVQPGDTEPDNQP